MTKTCELTSEHLIRRRVDVKKRKDQSLVESDNRRKKKRKHRKLIKPVEVGGADHDEKQADGCLSEHAQCDGLDGSPRYICANDPLLVLEIVADGGNDS